MFSKITIATVASLGMLVATSSAQAGPRVSFRFGPGGPQIVIGGNNHHPGHGHGHVRPLPVPIPQPDCHHYHVQFRQCHWQERSFTCIDDARNFANFKRSRGFDVNIVRHGHHYDVLYRMMNWRTYRTVDSDAYAHSLERNLERQGFEARVIHH